MTIFDDMALDIRDLVQIVSISQNFIKVCLEIICTMYMVVALKCYPQTSTMLENFGKNLFSG